MLSESLHASLDFQVGEHTIGRWLPKPLNYAKLSFLRSLHTLSQTYTHPCNQSSFILCSRTPQMRASGVKVLGVGIPALVNVKITCEHLYHATLHRILSWDCEGYRHQRQYRNHDIDLSHLSYFIWRYWSQIFRSLMDWRAWTCHDHIHPARTRGDSISRHPPFRIQR